MIDARRILIVGVWAVALFVPVRPSHADIKVPRCPTSVLRVVAGLSAPGSAVIQRGARTVPFAVQLTSDWAVARSDRRLRVSSVKHYRSPSTPGLFFFKSRAADVGRSALDLIEPEAQDAPPSQRASWVACGGRGRISSVHLSAAGVELVLLHRRGGSVIPFLGLSPDAVPGLGIGLREDGRAVGVGPVLVGDDRAQCVLYTKGVLLGALHSCELVTTRTDLAPEVKALRATASIMAWKDAEAVYTDLAEAAVELPVGHPWQADLLVDAAGVFLRLFPGGAKLCLGVIEGARPAVGDSASLDVLQGRLCLMAGRVEEGLVFLRTALSDPSSEWSARSVLVAQTLKIPERTGDLMAGVLPLPRRLCPPHLCGAMGAGLLNGGHMDAAGRLLRRATRQPLAEPRAFRQYALWLRLAGKSEEALRAMRAALADPRAPVLWYVALGDLLLSLNRGDSAEVAFSVVVQSVGGTAPVLRRRARARTLAGDAEGAIEDARRATVLAPQDAANWILAAHVAIACSNRSLLDESLSHLDDLDPIEAQRIRATIKTGGR